MTNIDQIISSVCKHINDQYLKNFERLKFYSPIRGELDINLLAIFATLPTVRFSLPKCLSTARFIIDYN